MSECVTCRTKAAGLPTPGYPHDPGCSQASRLTDEQVAEALAEAESVDRPCRLTVGWRRNSHERMAQLALQVSADLSAAKEELRQYKGVALLEAEAALSALQEKARAVLAARSCCDPDCCKASSEHTKALEALAEEVK